MAAGARVRVLHSLLASCRWRRADLLRAAGRPLAEFSLRAVLRFGGAVHRRSPPSAALAARQARTCGRLLATRWRGLRVRRRLARLARFIRMGPPVDASVAWHVERGALSGIHPG